MFGCKFWKCCGAICPVLRKNTMTQEVGIGPDGRLWTEPTTGSALNPIAKTVTMTQPVGVDGDGKLWTAPGGGGGATPITGTGDIYASGVDTGADYEYSIIGNTITIRMGSVPNTTAGNSLEFKNLPAADIVPSTRMLHCVHTGNNAFYFIPATYSKAANGDLIGVFTENVVLSSIPNDGTAPTSVGSSASLYYAPYLAGVPFTLMKS